MVKVSMSFKDSPHAKSLAELQQLLMFVCGIYEYRVARFSATNNEHIVVVGTDDQFVYFNSRI